MGAIIGEMLPFAVGIAISPVPIIVVILTLLSPRARSSSLGFLLGWVVGTVAVIVALTALASILPTHQHHARNSWEGAIKLVLGGLLIWLAVKQWRKRPHGDEKPELPAWMQKIDTFGFGDGLKFGLILSAANPKNVILGASVGVDLGAADLSLEGLMLAMAVFVLMASSTVIIPVVAYLIASDRMHTPLAALHTWLTRENHTIMAVLLFILGANALGNGIGAIWP
ncbi:GAP family protein [Microbacterium sp. A84]|uniref:GAP family protein n=1 Tax=Microbacterium sp. A84 TaxID=3450715 RepID=UPI003F442576